MIPIGPWLEHLQKHLPIAERGEDPEGVHQVRVATRRLDVWVQLFGLRVLRDDLAWLRRRNGLVRDLDVLLMRELPPAFGEWLKLRRRSARGALTRALGERRLPGLLEALALLAPLSKERAQDGMRALVARMRRLDEALEETPDEIEALHRVRRGLRRLRYAREWVGARTTVIAELQETFGAVGDLSVAARLAEACPSRRPLAAYRKQLAADLEAARAAALARWREARPRLLKDR